MPPTPDVHTLVVGAGGGGLVAALRAAESGADVALVEPSSDAAACDTALSSCMLPAAGTAAQQAGGVADDPRAFAADIRAKSRGTADPELAAALAEVSRHLVAWLRERGAVLELVTDFRYPGHRVPRMHTTPNRTGAELIRHLWQQVDAEPAITPVRPSRVGGLRRAGDLWEARLGSAELVTARRVVLACGGFAADRARVREHLPEMGDADHIGNAASDGTALRLGRELGAPLRFLDAYQGHGAVSDAGVPMTWAAIALGGFLVNALGQRFDDESRGYSEFAARTHAQPGGRAWMVFDDRIRGHVRAFTHFRAIESAGCVRTCDTAAELADRIGADRSAVAATLRDIPLDGPDAFGRRWSRSDQLAAPYHAVRVRGGLVHTQGGLAVDGRGRVPGQPGLWAAGGAAMGVSGHGSAGYLAGNGLLAALGLGFLAGSGGAGSGGPV